MTDPERSLNTFQALCSLFAPGFGQLLQKRPGAAFGFFVLFIITAIMPVAFLSDLFSRRFAGQPLEMYLFHILIFGGVCIPLMLAFFGAILDAAVWKQGSRTRFLPVGLVTGLVLCAILVALLLPAIPAAREPARRVQCMNNMRQIALAMHFYHDIYGSFPPAYTVDEDGQPLHSWRVLILPYIEQQALYEQIRLDEPWDSEHNRQFHDMTPWGFICPPARHRFYERCYYSVVIGPDTPFPGGGETVTVGDITGGTANVILVVERLTPVVWMNPNHEIRFDSAMLGVNRSAHGIGSVHPGGANVAFFDGSIKFLSDDTDPALLRALLMKSSGERVTLP